MIGAIIIALHCAKIYNDPGPPSTVIKEFLARRPASELSQSEIELLAKLPTGEVGNVA